jgi:hypothetical protein
MASAFTACAVHGSCRNSGHGNSPCASGSASCAVVATAGGRVDGATSGGEPGRGVWSEALRIGGPECCVPPYPQSPRGREVGTPGREAAAGKKTPLLAAYAAQGRGPDLAFGSRLGDERAWHGGLVVAPYLLVAYAQHRHGERWATGPVRAPLASVVGPIRQ